MSIVALNKVTVFGLPDDKQSILEDLQTLGCMHLIALQPPPRTSEFVAADTAADTRQALRYIMDVKRRRRQVRSESEFDPKQVIADALANKQKRRETEDKKLFLNARLNALKPWGNFTIPAAEDLGGYRLWFYRLPHTKIKALETLNFPWQSVGSDHRHMYVVVVAKAEPPADALPVERTHAGSISPAELEDQLEKVEVELDEIEAEGEALSRWIFLLSRNLLRAEDQAALEQAKSKTSQDGDLLMVQGWMPKRDLNRLEVFTRKQGLAFIAETPQPDDNPPTLMENPAGLRGGQDLVTFYKTPGYQDWDPSIVVFFSFAAFFAMILCDAGYALILAVIVAAYWKSMGKGPGGRNLRMLSVVGLLLAMFYGVLAGSYFGLRPPKGSLLAQFKLLNLYDYSQMMKVTITVGCFHLLLANAIVAYNAAGYASKAKPLGWMVVILGGLLMYLGHGRAGFFKVAAGLTAAGFVIIILFSSKRRPDSVKSVLLRLFDGFSSSLEISRLFGDVMSYLRLFALGLASASLALTFNQLALHVHYAVPGLGVLVAILILLLGHAVNLLVAIISGLVHGLRLNYIEFFNWGLSGEGYPFQAFSKKEGNQ